MSWESYLLANFLALVDAALAAIVAVTARARIALSTHLVRVVDQRIWETGFAFARETAHCVDAFGISTAVVQIGRAALVQIC